jgi:hypothetical protein
MKTKFRILSFFVLSLILVWACSDKIIEKPFISPPFPQLDQAYTNFELDAEKGDTLLFSSGSRIIVPPDIWVDSSGNQVKGKLNIKYREFSDAGDVFLSGIPLAYDTAGRKENLVTAGMFEIRSYKDSTEVFIGQAKNLVVQLASNESNADYNFYYLDENEKNWKYIGYAEPTVNPKIKEIKDSIEILKPSLPFPFDKSYFALNYNSILDVYFKDNYQIIRKNRKSNIPKNKAEQYGLTWSGISGSYPLTYNKVQYYAYQMVWQKPDGKKLPAIAKDCYVNELISLGNNLYNMKLVSGANTATIKVKAVMPLKYLFAYPPETWQQKYDEIMETIRKKEEWLAKQFEVYRTFEVSTTGFHNWDKIYKNQDKILVKSQFNFDKKIEGDMADLQIFYFLENNKSFIKFNYGEADSIMLVPDSTAKFVAVISDNEAAIFSSSDYKKINFDQLKNKNSSYTFNMKTVGISSKDDFSKLINMK